MSKLTKLIVDQAVPGSARYTLWDDEVRGFGVRISPSGQKSFILEYRAGAGGRGATKRKITLGVHNSDFTPDAARKEARAILADVRRGSDPAKQRRTSRELPSFRSMADDFLSEAAAAKLLKPASIANYKAVLTRYVYPALGSCKLDAISTGDVRKLHRAMGKTRPVTANRMLAAVGSVYRFAEGDEILPVGSSPARGIKKFKEEGRERYLNTEELQRLGAALIEGAENGLPWPQRAGRQASKHDRKPENQRTFLSVDETAAVRLLLFTGCRLREILHARWKDVDLERGMLRLPDSKSGRRTVILSAAAQDVLRAHSKSGDYVIFGNDPEKPRADLKRPWALITHAADLAGLRIHDLRHTFASVGAGGGLGLPVIGKLLGHADASVTQRYAHLADEQAKTAANLIAAGISAALGAGRPSAQKSLEVS
ncbi:MAG: site-specific integrase [Sphingomonadaceae bacterium]|nr:site-specific integrase [Sphingomonadaceae bacterium]